VSELYMHGATIKKNIQKVCLKMSVLSFLEYLLVVWPARISTNSF